MKNYRKPKNFLISAVSHIIENNLGTTILQLNASSFKYKKDTEVTGLVHIDK
jgi:hypothetical protein